MAKKSRSTSGGNRHSRPPVGLYEQVTKQCNLEQIRDLLREFKDGTSESKKEVLIGGNKENVIENLRHAVSHNFIPLSRVIDLLRDCEEHGQQHIFYYKPKSAFVSKCRDFDGVVEALIGSEWGPGEYPRFEYAANSLAWVDFRRDIHGKPRDWVFKAYGTEERYKEVDVDLPDEETKVVTLKKKSFRIICLVRWNDPDLLEIRIDSDGLDSTKAKRARLATMWAMLAPALQPAQFSEWNLQKAMTYMAQNHVGHPDYSLSDARATDKQSGSLVVSCATVDEKVENLSSRSKALKSVITEGGIGNAMTVQWILPTDNGKPQSLITSCGGLFLHEVGIRARTAAISIDHVTGKLRQFN